MTPSAQVAYKWLIWDGSYRSDGTQNRARRNSGHTRECLIMPTLRLDPQPSNGKPIPIIAATAISVRILKTVERRNDVAIKLRLERPSLIGSLMFRVYKNGEAGFVYREMLDTESIAQLPEAAESSDAGLPAESDEPHHADEPEGFFSDPYKMRVWVAHAPDAFGPPSSAMLSSSEEPPVAFATRVHDQSVPDETEIEAMAGRGLLGKHSTWRRLISQRLASFDVPRDMPGKNLTTRSYRIYRAAAGDPERIRDMLREAAMDGSPFTEALLRFAKPV